MYNMIGKFISLFLLLCGIGEICGLPTTDTMYLTKVDNLVFEKLVNPVAGEGEYVMDSIHIYWTTLNETVQGYMNDKARQDVVDILIEQNGPKCITPYINDRLLQKIYKWDVKELGEMYYMLGNIKMLWRDFRYYLNTSLGYTIDPLPLFFTTTVSSKTEK